MTEFLMITAAVFTGTLLAAAVVFALYAWWLYIIERP
jgi:hypothetical protein